MANIEIIEIGDLPNELGPTSLGEVLPVTYFELERALGIKIQDVNEKYSESVYVKFLDSYFSIYTLFRKPRIGIFWLHRNQEEYIEKMEDLVKEITLLVENHKM